MGSFEDFSWDGSAWAVRAPAPADWLTINIHDSDIGHVRFRTGDGQWQSAFVGILPEVYFDDPSLAQEHDFPGTAAALAARVTAGGGGPVDVAALEGILSAAADDEPVDDFVEETVDEVVRLLGLPALPWDDLT